MESSQYRPYKHRPIISDMTEDEIGRESLQNQRVITKKTVLMSNWIQFSGIVSVLVVIIYILAGVLNSQI